MDVAGFSCLDSTLDFDGLQRQQDLFDMVFVRVTGSVIIYRVLCRWPLVDSVASPFEPHALRCGGSGCVVRRS
jgi:hypothetical protein